MSGRISELERQLAAAQAAVKEIAKTGKRFRDDGTDILSLQNTTALDAAIDAATRIYTRCPACNNDTLRINKGHLLCTWHECPDPTKIEHVAAATKPLEDKLSAAQEEVRIMTQQCVQLRQELAAAQAN